jgi:hypothetical protein
MDGSVTSEVRGPFPWPQMRALWPRYTLLPALPFAGWPLYCLARGEFRWEFTIVVLLGAVMPYAGKLGKKLYLGLLPIGLVGLMYDSMRFFRNSGLSPESVHICDLRQHEMRLFGVTVNGQLGTVHDYIQAHTSLPLDLFFSVPYGTFIGAAFAFAFFLYFADYPGMQRFTWAFLLMNAAGFLTYHLYPAAPPWYFHEHGCIANLATHATEGKSLARVDAWLGFPYFHGFYGRSNDVFGAVPSLHCAYPLLIALEGWKPFGNLQRTRVLRWPLRIASVLFVLWMTSAAIYLDHHWIIDTLVGLSYAGLAHFCARALTPVFHASDEPAVLPSPPVESSSRA